MKTMTPSQPNRKSTPILWTPLPDCQQEKLSGGGPNVPPPPPGGGGGGSKLL